MIDWYADPFLLESQFQILSIGTYKKISWENNKSGREVDSTCKNKWNCFWLEEKDVNGDFILDYIRNIRY